MKKKLVLLFTLIVSLFIYSGRVEAIVMWMQCTDKAEGNMPHNLEVSDKYEEYKRYNTFAVINNYQSHGSAIKHVLYVGGTDSNGRSKNFFEVNGPTFMMNADGHRTTANDEMVCWFQKEGAGEGKIGKDSNGDDLTQCDEDDENVNPYIDVSNLNDGICPISIYSTTGNFLDWGTSGSTSGNFVVMTGSKKANSSNIEELNGYKLALYQASYTRYDGVENNFWIMEVYDDYGVYGNLFAMTPEIAASYLYNDPQMRGDFAYLLKNLNGLYGIYSGFFDINFCSEEITKNRDESESRNGILSNDDETCGTNTTKNYYSYDSEYIDYNQVTQLIKIYYTGRNYFKLTEFDKYPEVLIANIGGPRDNNSKKYIKESVHSYENGKKIWKEVEDWKVLVSDLLKDQSSHFSNFFEGGIYYNLLTEADKVSESISSGKKYELSVDSNGKLANIDGTIDDLNNAYNDIVKLLDDKYGYPTYKTISRDDGSSGTKLLCEQDGFTNDSAYSLADYVSCQTIGASISYATENFVGKNTSTVFKTFELAMSDQIKNITGNNGDLLNVNDKIKNYIISLSKYVSYINKNYADNLSDSQKNELEEILNNYLKLARDKFQIEIVVDCSTLLGEDFLNKIEKYVNIIKIAIPIILIGFGIYDFVSAVFAGDEDKMKKAQKKFIMRIVISILFFLLPFVIKLILTIANKAWSFISPSSCNFM